ncbi:MAG: hypothetical protein AAF560_28275 [Acidobacteriota bacterium]
MNVPSRWNLRDLQLGARQQLGAGQRRWIVYTLVLGLGLSSGALAGELTTLTLPGPGGNGGMYLPDLQASYPGVDWQALDRLYIPAAHYRFINLGNLPQRSPDHPLVITNQGGQVRVGGLDFYYNFSINGGSNWILTGRYDAAAQTGHVDFPGHAAGYRHSQGRYGILINDELQDDNSGLGIGGGATDFEIEFLEVTRVGFAGFNFKSNDNGDDHMSRVRIHDNYIHDVGSEGMYLGSTQAAPQHKLPQLEVYNNRVIRTGTEIGQFGHLADGSRIHHNVFVFGALDWKNPFQNFQDNGIQYDHREGSVEFDHNLVIGGADKFMIFFGKDWAGDVHLPTDVSHIHHNYFSHSRNYGAYIHQSGDGVTTYRITDNSFREINFHYDELNPGATDFNQVFRIFNSINPIELTNNLWDGPQSFFAASGGNVVASGNQPATIPPVVFVDSGFPADFDYLLLEIWTDVDSHGEPVLYEVGDYVSYDSVLYRCLEQHSGRIPPDRPDTWQPLSTPPDDYRLRPDSPFQGYGLLDNLVETDLFADGFEGGDTSAWQ